MVGQDPGRKTQEHKSQGCNAQYEIRTTSRDSRDIIHENKKGRGPPRLPGGVRPFGLYKENVFVLKNSTVAKPEAAGES